MLKFKFVAGMFGQRTEHGRDSGVHEAQGKEKMKKIRGLAVTLACLGMMFPQARILAAAPKAADKPVVKAVAAKSPIDVALAKGGMFQGHLYDDKGKAIEGAPVVIRQAGRVVAETTTQEDGLFELKNLRGGTYEVKAGKVDGVCRLWSPNTAPPAAVSEVTVVSGTNIVRGQDGGFFPGAIDPIDVALFSIGIAALITGIIAINKADEAKDAANATP